MNAIIIPSLDPDNRLIDLVNSLINDYKYIIIVNDGTKDKTIFNKLEKMNCIVLTHKENYGKGRAIKTAIEEVKKHECITGIITADSDGQHTKDDIDKISKYLENNPCDIVLGTRNIKKKNVPLRSKIGNTFSSIYFYLETGTKCKDTQTGLRGIPKKYFDLSLSTPGERFEYEMNFLLDVCKKKIPIKYIDINTIYENKNKSSHFRTFTDSYIIYKKLFKFTTTSLTSALVDLVSFKLLLNFTKIIFISNLIARIISGTCNFILKKLVVFETKKNTFKESIKFLILFIFVMLASSTFTHLLSILKINIILIKIFVDSILFILNYVIQNKFIFKKTISN